MNFLKNKKEKNGGISILGILILGILVILVLSYFHISIQAVVESPDAQGNLHYVGRATESIWEHYLERPLHYLWYDVFIAIFWQSFINNMERIRDGQKTDYELYAPIPPGSNSNNSR